jgi:hypothetical protein
MLPAAPTEEGVVNHRGGSCGPSLPLFPLPDAVRIGFD